MEYYKYFLEDCGDFGKRRVNKTTIYYHSIEVRYFKSVDGRNFFRVNRQAKKLDIIRKFVLIILMSGLFFLVPAIVIPRTVLKKDFTEAHLTKSTLSYAVKKLKRSITIDGNWDKPQWKSVKAIHLSNYMGQIPSFRPNVYVKMMYDKDNLYLIFKVKDRFVRSIVDEYNGPVSTDACVEFFFSPDISFPERYFNLEINAGGIPLMSYHVYGQKEYQKFSIEDLKKIEIAHSLPGKVDTEIVSPITWTIEYKLPVSILKKYGSVAYPEAGKIWKANFYKTASKGSNPHYITWSKVDNEKPNFHLPQFFGEIKFK